MRTRKWVPVVRVRVRPPCALPRAGVQLWAREKLSCNREPVGASAPFLVGWGRWQPLQGRASVTTCRVCACARVCQHDLNLKPVDCLT
jgi:hypothetical protein